MRTPVKIFFVDVDKIFHRRTFFASILLDTFIHSKLHCFN